MKLNLGSGINGVASLNVITMDQTGWKFIDICKDYPAHEHYDITTGIREEDNTIEEIWMGDFFEHLMRKNAKFVIQECFRVLKKDGKLRVSVPDMAVVMPLWLAHNTQLDCAPSFINGAPLFNDTFVMLLDGCIWGGQDDLHGKNCEADTHYNGYTEKSLKKLAKLVGFSNINRISIHGTWFELAIEAYK